MYEQKHVLWFVKGAVADYYFHTKTEESAAGRTIYMILDTVLKYLNGGLELDGRCSDLECNIALEAEKLFKPKAPSTAADSVKTIFQVFKKNGHPIYFSNPEEAEKFSCHYGSDEFYQDISHKLFSTAKEAYEDDVVFRRNEVLKKLNQEEKELLGLA